MTKALATAQEKLNQANYLSECGGNPGLRQMNSNKAEWLKWVVYLAEYGLKSMEEEDRLAAKPELVEDEEVAEAEDGYSTCEDCPVTAEALKLIEVKNNTIKELTTKIEKLTTALDTLQTTYDCELACREALVHREKLDCFTKVSEIAHERCWLNGTVLVTPVESLDRRLFELIKEED
jgi:hypothetical protein